jgi:hypothetical protein
MKTQLTILALVALAFPAFAQNRVLSTTTNGTVISGRTNALTLSNPLAWNNSTNAATTITNLFSGGNSLPSGAAPDGAVLTAVGGQGVFAGYIPGQMFDFTTTSGPAGATAVTNGTTNVVWTWTAPTTFQRLQIIAVGGGGGGGSGRVSATNVAAFGGGGGAGGNVSEAVFPNIGGPITVTVPFGGRGGSAQTTNDSNGFAGTNGINASVGWTNGTSFHAGGGGGGGAGTTTSGTAGPAPAFFTHIISGSGGAAVTNGIGFAADINSGWGHAGGNPGASVTASNTTFNGGGARRNNTYVASTYGPPSAPGTAGSNPVVYITNSLFGNGGGGGGGGGLTNNGGAGSSPTTFGSGGGGGAGARNGFSSGAGGNGGPGAVRIIGL